MRGGIQKFVKFKYSSKIRIIIVLEISRKFWTLSSFLVWKFCIFCKNSNFVIIGNNHSPANVSTNNDNEWTSLSPKSLWKQINEEAESYYKFELNSDNVDGICEVFGLQKVSLMRAVCKAAGIQLVLREYSLDNNGKIFTDEDVINVFPVVKHINPRATDAYNFYTTGQSKIQQGNVNFFYIVFRILILFLSFISMIIEDGGNVKLV